MTSLQTIGSSSIERDQRWWIDKRVTTYRPEFWFSWIQRFQSWLMGFMPSLRRDQHRQNLDFLKLVLIYKPKILFAYFQYEKQFNRWEWECQTNGHGSQEASDLEHEAKIEAQKFTKELGQELSKIGWPYKPVANFEELVHSCDSYLRMDAVRIYWDDIECFLRSRTF